MTYEVTSLPAPVRTRTSLNTPKYPFAKLQPGEGFVEKNVIDAKKAANRLQGAASAYRKRLGADAPKFSVYVVKQEDGTDAVAVRRHDAE